MYKAAQLSVRMHKTTRHSRGDKGMRGRAHLHTDTDTSVYPKNTAAMSPGRQLVDCGLTRVSNADMLGAPGGGVALC